MILRGFQKFFFPQNAASHFHPCLIFQRKTNGAPQYGQAPQNRIQMLVVKNPQEYNTTVFSVTAVKCFTVQAPRIICETSWNSRQKYFFQNYDFHLSLILASNVILNEWSSLHCLMQDLTPCFIYAKFQQKVVTVTNTLAYSSYYFTIKALVLQYRPKFYSIGPSSIVQAQVGILFNSVSPFGPLFILTPVFIHYKLKINLLIKIYHSDVNSINIFSYLMNGLNKLECFSLVSLSSTV